MKFYKLIAVMLILALVIGTSAGCGDSLQEIPEDSFTLEDLVRSNSYDVIFSQYSAVFATSAYYGFVMAGETIDLRQNSAHVKGENGMNLFVEFDDGNVYAIKDGNVYRLLVTGEYGVVAFFDDGYFETYYQPYVTEWLAFMIAENEEIISVSVEDGIRTVVTHVRASDLGDFDMWGLPDGIIECIFEVDAESGIYLRSSNYLIPDDAGEQRLLSTTEMRYGNAEDFTIPEYIQKSRDMSDTRTVTFIRDPNTPEEKAFNFTVPKNAALFPEPMGDFLYFLDSEGTIPYERTPEAYPDELTIYMKRSLP